ncbi:MAG: DMT family transporter [Pseudomonadota bacterium]
MSLPPFWLVVMGLERRLAKRQSGIMAAIDLPSVARPTDRPVRQPAKAACLAVMGMGIIGVVDNVMPEVARHIGIAQFHIVRSSMALCIIVPLLMARGGLWPVNPWGVLGRSMLMTLGMGLYFVCVGFLPVAQVLAGVFTAPLWVMVVTLLRGHRVEPMAALLIVMGFAGCVAVVQPSVTTLNWLSLGPLGAGFFYGMGGLVTRSWTGRESVWTLTGAYLALFGLAAVLWLAVQPDGGTGYLTRGWVAMPWHVVLFCALQALAAVFAVALLARAYQLAAPAYVGAFEYTVLIVAAGVGFSVWGHALNGLAIFGVIVILASGAALAALGDRA